MKMRRLQFSRMCLFAACLLVILAGVANAADKKDKQSGRLLYGKVLDQQDNPVVDAVVYVTDRRTHAVKTYIVGADGTYRFPALASSVDYEVFAQFKGRKSETKSLNQFDDRTQVYIDLRINLK
jgi:ABC-type sugar transport system substrate-binding protein